MKTFTLLLLLVLTTPALAQIKKGQYLLGGGINFESTKEDSPPNNTTTSNNFFISPSIGYFMFDKMAGGLRLSLSIYNLKSEFLETHTIATGIAPFLRYYLLPVSEKVNAFIDIAYLQNKSKWSTPANPGYHQKFKGYSILAGPSIFLSRQIALEFIVGFKHTKSNDFNASKSNKFNSGFGLQIHFGKDKIRNAPLKYNS